MKDLFIKMATFRLEFFKDYVGNTSTQKNLEIFFRNIKKLYRVLPFPLQISKMLKDTFSLQKKNEN